MKFKKFLIYFTVFTFTLLFHSIYVYAQASIKLFSPQGYVNGVKQVKVVFSEQIVTFGDINAPQPFDIKCDIKGKGTWLDEKTWIYDFEREIPAGVRCEFTLRAHIKTLSGREIVGQKNFQFNTGGPSIIQSFPGEVDGIDENQAFILHLDGEPDESSVLSNVYCAIEGINERVGIIIIKGEERYKILRSYGLKESELKNQFRIIVQCKRTFPNNSRVKLIWGKGVKSSSGIENQKEQVLNFKTREAFTINLKCSREKPDSGCIPLLPIRVYFSSMVPIKYAEKIVLKGTKKTYKPSKYEGDSFDEDDKEPEFVREVIFKGPFPEKETFTLEIPKDIKDEDGRIPLNIKSFPLKVKTEEYPPLAKFSSRFGIIELKEPTLPVTLRNIESQLKTRLLSIGNEDKKEKTQVNGKVHKVNLERETKIIEWLKIVENASRRKPILKKVSETKEFSLPKPHASKDFEVVGIPLKEAGFYVVELESEILGASLLGEKKPMYVQTAALVTNLSVHFKWGRENSLVWVTTLEGAEPVKDAEVKIRDCSGKLIWTGKTDSNGLAYVKQNLPQPKSCKAPEPNEESHLDSKQLKSLRDIYEGYFVFARKDNDLSFVHSSWDDGIEPWRFKLTEAWDYQKVKAHTIFDRMLLRAGETLHMKHIIRKRTISGFEYLSERELPNTLQIQHLGSNQSYEFPIKWDKNGVAESVWHIPKDAKLGSYEVILYRKEPKKSRDNFEENTFSSGIFRIEEFRVPLMKGIIKPSSTPLINPSKLDLDIFVGYLAGGGFSNGNIKIRAKPYKKRLFFDDYEDFVFSNGELKEGIFKDESFTDEESQIERAEQKIYSRHIVLDNTGSSKVTIEGLAKILSPEDMHVEIEFRDPNGEINTVSTRIPIYSSSILLGISPESWAASKENLRFKVLALDLQGKPLSNVPIRVNLLKKKYYSHRKKLIGGFYAYEHMTEIKSYGEICKGITDQLGILTCEVKSPVAGNVILQAYANDEKGNPAVVHRDLWVVDKEDAWFDISDSDRIDILPEKKRYSPGEKAKVQVRMPFRQATALITVEREGIIDAFVKKIGSKNPVVEIPIKDNYAPNVFISLLCLRGRVSDIKPTATVDLGKPAFKLGYTEIKVDWDSYELKVNVSTDKTVYKVREKAYAKIRVTKKDGTPLGEKGEVTVAAIDEGLLELMPNKSWRLLESMMGKRAIEVKTSTAQMQVVGKRHFGLKALPQGGGGGKQVTRELFDTLLLWKGRVPLDDKGEATVEIPLNDSITSFRIVAVAHSGKAAFGTGEASIRTTQDLIIFSGLPPFVREGDKFFAGFTFRNTSDKPMDLTISGSMNANPLSEQSIKLEPGEAKEIGWNVTVPNSINNLQWEVSALDKTANISDRIKVKQTVGQAIPVRVYQATLRQIDKPLSIEVEKPAEALLNRGGLRVSLSSRISEGLYGVEKFMRDYSYTCLEQKISQAIALQDQALWQKTMAELPSYLDSEGLVKYFPSMLHGSDYLTAYVLSISHESGFEIPLKLKESMLEALLAFVEGRIKRASPISAVDLTIRKLTALEALSRFGKVKIEHMGTLNMNPNLLPTSAVLDWINILIRMPALQDRDKKLNEAQNIIRSRLDLRGTKLSFSSASRDNLWWLMISEDLNALRTILTFLNFRDWEEDIPKIVNGSIGMLKSGHWNTTTANAWGVLAVKKFSEKYEKTAITGETIISLNKEQKNVSWDKTPKGQSINFPWHKEKRNLSVEHKGTGKPWVTISSLSAIPLKEPLWNGFTVKKRVILIERKLKDRWSVGDTLKVSLEFEAKSDMTWVVVNDPIPAGASILRVGLGRDSGILTDKIKSRWLSPAYEERSFEAYRAYYEYLPKGKWTVEYIIRLNNAGFFNLPPTRIEALYFPDMFGELPNGRFEIVK
ncbi:MULTISPECIES: alpha-2-macroglobulin family protein [Thermodesulfovibrio]|uniref:alpha-2-macroglobulin family protein n=1 Tax=Thermodesulfovibrio TaxID=28261 RepID=UPI0026165822|nr:MG2 domain-containing protein [Thermodesulfovibrio sp.]